MVIVMTKYVCVVCNKTEWSKGYSNQTGGIHPRVCIHGDVIIVMNKG